MAAITKLRVAHAICVNLVDATSLNDPRMRAIVGIRDGIAESITDLEFDEPKGL